MFDANLQRQLGELRLEELRREALHVRRLGDARAARRPVGALRKAAHASSPPASA